MKKRTGRHETTIRDFALGGEGVVIGEPLTSFRGVLGGTPVYEPPAAAPGQPSR
jgi:circadian clock protein KaiC